MNLAVRLQQVVPNKFEDMLRGFLSADFFTKNVPQRVAELKKLHNDFSTLNDGSTLAALTRKFLIRVIGDHDLYFDQLNAIQNFKVFLSPPSHADAKEEKPENNQQPRIFHRQRQRTEINIAALRQFIYLLFQPQRAVNGESLQQSIDVTQILQDKLAVAVPNLSIFDELKCGIMFALISGEVIKLKNGNGIVYIGKAAFERLEEKGSPFNRQNLREHEGNDPLSNNEYCDATEEYRETFRVILQKALTDKGCTEDDAKKTTQEITAEIFTEEKRPPQPKP